MKTYQSLLEVMNQEIIIEEDDEDIPITPGSSTKMPTKVGKSQQNVKESKVLKMISYRKP